VDYRAYVAGIRNIEGHYFYDTSGTLEPHVDVYGSVLRRNPESVQRARVAAELVLQHSPKVIARQEPEIGGSRAAANEAERIEKNIAHVDAISTDSTGSERTLDSGKPGNGMLTVGRHTLVGLRLEEQEAVECRSWIYRTIKFIHIFRDDQGRRYCWYGSNPRPVNLRGYRYPGRYPVLRGVPLTFAANIREVWPDGTVSLSRPYLRLDRQPEASKRSYVEEYNIPLHELGLEAGGDVIGVDNARSRDHRRPAPHQALSDERHQVQSRSGRYIDERQLHSGSASAYVPEWAEPKVKNR